MTCGHRGPRGRGRDHPVLGDAAHDAQDAVIARFDVLACHQAQKLDGGGGRRRDLLAVKHTQGGQRVADQGVDQSFSGRKVVRVTRGLAWRGVVVVSQNGISQPGGQRAGGLVESHEHLADRGSQLGDGVLGGHRVEDGGGVEHPSPALHGPRRLGHHLGVLEETARAHRGT